MEIGEPAWSTFDRIADVYAAHEWDRADRRRYEVPALRSLIGDPSGRRVLDLCCGSGENTLWLARRGATVIARDGSVRLLEHLRSRLTEQELTADVDRLVLPGDFRLSADNVDLVVMSLALHFLTDWTEVLHEAHRVLRSGGCLVASVCHPADVLHSAPPGAPVYFESTSYEIKRYGEQLTIHRRSLEEIFKPFFSRGFLISGLVEPRLRTDVNEQNAPEFEQLRFRPKWVCFRMVKP